VVASVARVLRLGRRGGVSNEHRIRDPAPATEPMVLVGYFGQRRVLLQCGQHVDAMRAREQRVRPHRLLQRRLFGGLQPALVPGRALTILKRLNVSASGSISPDAIDGEMGQGRPVSVNVYWAGGGGHNLALRGRYTLWDPNTQSYPNWVSASDPWYGDSEVLYNTFLTSYQGSGSWGWTCTTKP